MVLEVLVPSFVPGQWGAWFVGMFGNGSMRCRVTLVRNVQLKSSNCDETSITPQSTSYLFGASTVHICILFRIISVFTVPIHVVSSESALNFSDISRHSRVSHMWRLISGAPYRSTGVAGYA
ncbi:hypothetical protein NEOLEDRAFT_1142381 [Neolentinus lepideus HHB14362 ss-1]|uniref:Uncharacterized protein n=1 Tax=Neolentinus lepideus HHB14362 ss-1 TaxID=1314782 RepID=A0A165N5G6_9AGAM|nr:hypothetical protein NEOLEDRAFT_1142381 [Neolentinus lepideus HHB14362 ss-1]